MVILSLIPIYDIANFFRQEFHISTVIILMKSIDNLFLIVHRLISSKALAFDDIKGFGSSITRDFGISERTVRN